MTTRKNKTLIDDNTKVSEGKLIPNLEKKEKYLIHVSLYALFKSLGVKFTKLHRVIQFDQENLLKEFVEIGMKLRKKATSEFEKALWKLVNNALTKWGIKVIQKNG